MCRRQPFEYENGPNLQDGVGRAGSGRTAFIRQPLEYEDRPNLLSYTKKNTSNRGGDKEAAEKDSVQVSEGFTFDLAERHRTFFEYVRDQKWDSVASYLDRKGVLYSDRGSLYLNVCV